MYFDLINSNLKALSLQTELLEACDWDEEKLELVMQSTADYLNNYDLNNRMSWHEVRAEFEFHLQHEFNKQVSDIIINIFELKKNEFIKLTELPEQ